MASKRTFDEKDHHNNDDTHLQTVVKRSRDETNDPSLLPVAGLEPAHLKLVESVLGKLVEPVLRKYMEELIPPMLERHVSLCFRFCHNHQGGSSGGRAYRLCFVNELPKVIFTMTNLTAEDGGSLQIELRDAASQQSVDPEEFSSMKAQIYVLDGAFESQDWTAEEFDGNVVKPREGKGKLLRGETVIKIEKGAGFIDKRLQITDISSNTTTKTFRLGVKIVGSNSHGVGIREAISEPFRVKDKRGESTKKSERPALNDEVWRLRNIGKTGKLCKQLSEKGIEDVKELLRWNTMGLLQKTFDNIKTWDKIIKHAEECKLDPAERYGYKYDAEPGKSFYLVFNCIYALEDVYINGKHRSQESLNSEDEHLVGKIKEQAYLNPKKNLVQIDIESKLIGTQAVSDSAPYQGGQLANDHGQSETSKIDIEWDIEFFKLLLNDDIGASCSKDSPFSLANTADYIPRKGKMVSQEVENSLTPHTSENDGLKEEPIILPSKLK